MKTKLLILSFIILNLSQTVYASSDKQIWDIDNDIKRQLYFQLKQQSITIDDVQAMAGDFDLRQDSMFKIFFLDTDDDNKFSQRCSSSSSSSSYPASTFDPDIKILYTSPEYKNAKINQNQILKNEPQPDDDVNEKAEQTHQLTFKHTPLDHSPQNKANLLIMGQDLLQEFDKRKQLFIQECINGEQIAKSPLLNQQLDDTDYCDNQELTDGRRHYEQQVRHTQYSMSLIDQSDRNSLSHKYMQHTISQLDILDKLIGKCIKDYQIIPDSITNLDQCMIFIKRTTDKIIKACDLYNTAIVNDEHVDFYFNQLFMLRKQLEIGLYTKSVLEASLGQDALQKI